LTFTQVADASVRSFILFFLGILSEVSSGRISYTGTDTPVSSTGPNEVGLPEFGLALQIEDVCL